MGGDCVKALPVSQLPDLTGVVSTSCCQVIPEWRNIIEAVNSDQIVKFIILTCLQQKQSLHFLQNPDH